MILAKLLKRQLQIIAEPEIHYKEGMNQSNSLLAIRTLIDGQAYQFWQNVESWNS